MCAFGQRVPIRKRMKDTEYQKGFGYTVMSNTNSVHAPHIVVLGSANVDISARTPVFPRDGETVTGDTVLVSTGGKGTNQAVSASRAGAQVTMIGRLGCDFFADIPAKLYEREGIDTRFVGRDSEHGTGCALIEVHTGTGENRITVVPGANMAVTAEDVAAAEAEIAKADILLTQRETHPDSIEAFLKLGAKYGKKVILNPAPALPIPDAWYPLIDTITPNETEAEAYTGVTVTDDASALRAAEIFAGAIRDYEYGTLIGTKTYGKGIVQAVVGLSDQSGMQVTIAQYFTPNGNKVHQVGITPDVEVQLPEGDIGMYQFGDLSDPQLSRALEIMQEKLAK